MVPSTRGILKPEEALARFLLQTHRTHPELEPWIEFYWNDSWDPGENTFDQTVVTNPTINLSFERDPAANGSGPGPQCR